MMFPNCCCGCNYFTDDYSTDNLATDYTAASGSWAVTGGKLTTSSSNALLIVNATSGSNYHVTTATVTMAASGDENRVVVGYVDTDNYIFLELVQGATTATAKLYKRVAGINTQIGVTKTLTLSPGSALTFSICCGPELTVARFSRTVKISDSFISTGNKIGFASGTVGSSVTFDDLTLSKHSTDNATCVTCNTVCNKCLNDIAADNYALLMPDDLTSDVGCEGCANVAGTWVATQFFNPFPTCSWLAQGPQIGGCNPFVAFSIGLSVRTPADLAWDGGPSPGTYRLIATLDPGGTQLVWQKDFGTDKPDCMNFDNEELTIVYAGTALTRCKSTANKSVFVTAVNT